jgi:acyl-CoA thioesterase YciA
MASKCENAARPDVPRGELASRILAMPADANPNGTIFGGRIMALMDAAAMMTAAKHAEGRVVTVGVSKVAFLRPVSIGDAVCCYTEILREILRKGKTSITLNVQVWVLPQARGERMLVTEAEFTFVAVDENGRPHPIQ